MINRSQYRALLRYNINFSRVFAGSIPGELGELSSVLFVYLRGNKLSGESRGPQQPLLITPRLQKNLMLNATPRGQDPTVFNPKTLATEFVRMGTSQVVQFAGLFNQRHRNPRAWR